MNKALTLIAIAIFVSGCSTTDYARTAEERHQVAKVQYYENLNQRQNIGMVALNDEKVEQ